MADIFPFKGYLPNPNLSKKVSSPPYDVISSQEAKIISKNNPDSFLRIIKPEIDFQSDDNINIIALHQHAKKNLNHLITQKKLIQDSKSAFYIYEIGLNNHVQTGIVASTSIKEYNNDLIKKHELTRPDKENDRTKHIEITNANTGPVFLTFKAKEDYKKLIFPFKNVKPFIMFQAEDQSIHKIWKVFNEKDKNNIKNYFHNVSTLYIADGHHRAASASRVQKLKEEKNPKHNGSEPYNYFLSVIFPHDEMQILDYNRVIRDLNGLSSIQLIELIKTNFNIFPLKKAIKPNTKHHFSMFIDNQWYKLIAKNKIISKDPIDQLDASILQNFLLEPFLNISNPRQDKKIDFVGGTRGLNELEKRCNIDCKIAFALYPVSINDLLLIADSGQIMPPKSTWFEPKLRSGLIVRLFD